MKLRGLAEASREKMLGRWKQLREEVCLIYLWKKKNKKFTRAQMSSCRHNNAPGIFKQLTKTVGSVNFQRI